MGFSTREAKKSPRQIKFSARGKKSVPRQEFLDTAVVGHAAFEIEAMAAECYPFPTMFEKPLHERTETFRVRAVEAGTENRVSVPAICDYLQEIAGNHAKELGVGIQALQAEGLTWMLARLRLAVSRFAGWGDDIVLRTWPSGTRGRLTALRDFEARDSAGGALFNAASEWLYVDVKAQRIVKLPDVFAALAPEGSPRAEMPGMPEKFPPWPERAEWACEVCVRKSDQDFNRHVNNAHYVEWVMEPLPDSWLAGRRLATLDIQFRQAAHCGERVSCEAAREGEALLHRIVRLPDRAVLAQARSTWQNEKEKDR
jgi:medium-chain acyl-[acyl-carrier-protein] hydrolase